MALTAQSPRKSEEEQNLCYYPMAVVVAYQGGLAVLDSTGYVKPGVSATSLTAVGIFDFTADIMEGKMDNSAGSAGDLYARVRRGIFCFKNKSADLVVEADVGKFCYVYDDETVCHTGTSRSVAGIVRRVDSDGVWVHIGAAFGEALTSEISSRAQITTDLASTANGKGASLIGIEDSAGKITATTVEAALAEGIDGRRVITAAAGNTIGAVPVKHIITVADGSTVLDALTLDATFGKLVVTDVYVLKTGSTGGSTDAVQVTTDAAGNTAVSSSLALNTIAAGGVVRTTSITNNTFAAGAHIYVKRTHTTDCGCTLIIKGYRSA